jgi:cytochrome c biogenesis DsbD-like protein
MLSDQGSRVIRDYGILNTNIPKSLPLYGIPFPGQYLIGPDSVVRDKQFLNDYRERPTASEVLLKDFGVAGGRKLIVRADDVEAVVQLSAIKAFAGQELGIAVDFHVKPPWHVYGEPLPQNYTATSLRFDDAGVSRQSLTFPKPQPVTIASLGETLPVYTGSFRAAGALVLKRNLKPGDHQLSGALRFQECNSEICKLPRTVDFTLPIAIEPPAAAANG